MAVIAPEASKAAVLTEGPGMIHMSVPIEKAEDTDTINPVDGTPDIVIAGKCTDGTLDSDLQVVDPEASLRWVKTWYDTKANIRLGHDPKQPVGRGIEVDGHYIRAIIADPKAKHLIRTKVLNDFSVGIMNPDVRKGDPRFRHLDPMGKAVNGVITDRADGLTGLGEISVVDRGANFGAAFSLLKAAADGSPEWVGKMVGPEDVIAKAATPVATKERKPRTVSVDLPRKMSLSIKPTDLAKLQTLGRELAVQQGATKAAAVEVGKAATGSTFAPAGPEGDALKAVMAAESGIYKRDIDTATRRRLASEGNALPNLSYPIENAGDLANAATLARSGHGDVAAARKLIGRRAKELGVKNPLKAGKKAKATKTASPDVVKCGTCDGEGMAGGKPCPDCKAGRKKGKRVAKKQAGKASAPLAASSEGTTPTPGVTKKKGKIKALCPNCGAKQNRKHAHCPECGHTLPAGAPVVHKNHDYVCLGCGKELDKGERFCPGCGKENPGHNPMADRKIPANSDKATKARKDRVAKGKGGKKGKGRTPAPASGAVSAPQRPAGPHREPDGAEVEAFEDDAGMQDGDSEKPTRLESGTLKSAEPKAGGKGKGKKGGKGKKKMPPWMRDGDGEDESAEKAAGPLDDPQVAAALRLKTLGVPLSTGTAHDLTCPALDPAAVAECYPAASLATLDTAEWQGQVLEKAAGGDLATARDAAGLLHAVIALRSADPSGVADIREGAHKSFRDVNPGPATFPTPTQISPERFRRPYLHEGRAAPSPGQDPPHHAQLPPAGGLDAEDFTRGFLSGGRAAGSPANTHPEPPMPTPERTGEVTGAPSRTYYRNSAREGAEHAMRVLHDHISQTFPGLCSMHPGNNFASRPVPTPEGVPPVTPAPGTGKAAGKTAAAEAKRAERDGKRKAAKIRKRAAARRRAVESGVLKGKLTVDQGRERLGLAPWGLPETTTAPQDATIPAAAALDPKMVAKAITRATKPLLKTAARQDRALRRQGKVLDAIAGQPDTSAAPFRGVALPKTAASPAGVPFAAKSAQDAQAAAYARLYETWRTSTTPEQQEAAWGALRPYWDPNMTPSPMPPPT